MSRLSRERLAALLRARSVAGVGASDCAGRSGSNDGLRDLPHERTSRYLEPRVPDILALRARDRRTLE